MHFCDTLKIREPNLDNISLMNSGELHLAVTKRKNINLTLRRIFFIYKKKAGIQKKYTCGTHHFI